ncbi:Glu/Leu/Phe/Val dehydrogenase dimerization domain-containing protein [Catenulispora yoronensis]|uniref:Glu/Leu/Phe/Val dehydrogenase dimerization domain-containing protein n=1 Tax=Catenulispora yoronensis TaxID=450799 RepID=A0ABN2TV51_9ACTN
MSVFSELDGHEQVIHFSDERSGLRAIIAIHNTVCGPALGGTRMYPYADEREALADVLRLSRGMTYKSAVAKLDLGGGKAVIIGDPAVDKTPQLLAAYARCVQSLDGRYLTACDVGTTVEDMDVLAKGCDFVVGRSTEQGGSGDSSVLTALGVFQGMRACAGHRWGVASLRARRVGVAGVGKVGRRLIEHLRADGAYVIAADPDPAAHAWLAHSYPEVELAADTAALAAAELDVFAPCALGGALDDDLLAVLTARIVCGAANNQLAYPGIDKQLRDRGVLYAPDFVVNAGGVIQAGDEAMALMRGDHFHFPRAGLRAAEIFDTTVTILRAADDADITPAQAADRLAEERIDHRRAVYC